MIKKITLLYITTIVLLLFSSASYSQTLELLSLESFELYTGAGAVTNEGEVIGDAGTNNGIISGTGFDPANGYTGTTYENDATTVQARIDLLRVYIHLSDVFVTNPYGAPNGHAPAFGGGETVFAGVYSIGGAGSIGGALTLDGQGDPDAFFIIKFEGGLSVGAGTTIALTGGARAANVFWIAEGAIPIGANSVLKGTFISHPGAISLGTNCTIDGRLLASEGAITIGAGSVASTPTGVPSIPINCLGLCTANPLVDVLGSVSNFALFTSDGAVANAATSGIVGDIGTNNGIISGFTTSTHVGSFYPPGATTAQAVLDLDNAYNQLIALPVTEAGHAPAFGTGETVFAGVYYIAGAGSLAGTIILDGQNDPDAIFVFRFNGAFSVAAQSKVILINGARRCNLFWISEGAATMGTFTYMKGTVLAHGGACTMGANGNLEGRMLSTAGAIGFSTGVIYNDTLCGGDDTPISGGDQVVCSDGTTTQTLTATATSNSNNGTIIWYDAETEGNVVDPPTQVGVGSVTYWAASFNGTYPSPIRTAVTLSIIDCVPDYKPTIFTGSTNIIGSSGIIDFRVLIAEYLDVNSDGITNVELRIFKNTALNISFDSNISTFNSSPVSNPQWVYDGSHPAFHKFTYVGNGGIFQKNTGQFIGISATYNPLLGSLGVFPLKVTIKYLSGGETNTINNDDIDYIEYKNN